MSNAKCHDDVSVSSRFTPQRGPQRLPEAERFARNFFNCKTDGSDVKLKVTVAVRVRFSKNGPLCTDQPKGTGEIGHDRICFDKRTRTGCIVRREYRKVLVSRLLTHKKGWEKRTGHSRRLISESSRRARSPWKRSHAPPSGQPFLFLM